MKKLQYINEYKIPSTLFSNKTVFNSSLKNISNILVADVVV